MRVAVWMTNYQNAEHLPGAIRSVLDQTYRDFELFIFDNYSPDPEVARILADAPARSAAAGRVQVCNLPPGLRGIGVMGYVWNFLSALNQDYSIHIGGHDLWDAHLLDALVQRFDNERAWRARGNGGAVSIVFPDTYQCDEQGNLTSRYADAFQLGQAPQALVPQLMISGVSSPQLFGLWDERIRRACPVRHLCSGWDHLIVTEAATHGAVIREDLAKLVMRRPPVDDDLTKYGLRHLTPEQRAAGPADFVQQLDWLVTTLDKALEDVPEPAKPLYRALLTSSLFASYVALRGLNLHIVPGAMQAFNEHPLVRGMFSSAQAIDDRLRLLLLEFKERTK